MQRITLWWQALRGQTNLWVEMFGRDFSGVYVVFVLFSNPTWKVERTERCFFLLFLAVFFCSLTSEFGSTSELSTFRNE